MSTQRIQALLDTQLQTTTSLPGLQLENKRYTLDGFPFVRSTLMPARSNVLTVGYGAKREYQGLYQITAWYPQDGGSTAARTMADSIVDQFPIGMMLSDGVITVRIIVASVMPSQSMTNMFGVPIQIQWSVFK